VLFLVQGWDCCLVAGFTDFGEEMLYYFRHYFFMFLKAASMNIRSPRKLITFDWAMKRLLRSKANFEILEGFLSELLGEDITILEILESESNKESKLDKFNRVDLKVKNGKDEIIISFKQGEGNRARMSSKACASKKDFCTRISRIFTE